MGLTTSVVSLWDAVMPSPVRLSRQSNLPQAGAWWIAGPPWRSGQGRWSRPPATANGTTETSRDDLVGVPLRWLSGNVPHSAG
jgi:hypothetical protein